MLCQCYIRVLYKDGNLSQGTKKKVRDSRRFEIAKLEIARQILPSEGLNAEGTDVLFEIARYSRETPLYVLIANIYTPITCYTDECVKELSSFEI